jgi:hypothetical protein
MNPYRVLHLDIDGAIEDRETGHPELELELRPLGTELPPERQTLELRLKIRSSSTVLDQSGIDQLKAFLEMKP